MFWWWWRALSNTSIQISTKFTIGWGVPSQQVPDTSIYAKVLRSCSGRSWRPNTTAESFIQCVKPFPNAHTETRGWGGVCVFECLCFGNLNAINQKILCLCFCNLNTIMNNSTRLQFQLSRNVVLERKQREMLPSPTFTPRRTLHVHVSFRLSDRFVVRSIQWPSVDLLWFFL